MSDRQLGPDEPVASDDPALPPDVWDSLFWACVLPSEGPATDDEAWRVVGSVDRPLALPPAAEHDPPAPRPAEHVAVEVVARPAIAAAPRRPRRQEIARRLRASTAVRAAVVTLVLGTAVIATAGNGDDPRSDLVRSGAPTTVSPAEAGSPATTAQVPMLQEPTASTTPAPAADVTSTTAATTTTAAMERTTTVAPPRTTQARTSRPPPTAAPTRQAPPATTAPAFDPVCGFAAGSSVDVNLNGTPLGLYTADEKGCVHVPAPR